MRLNYREVLARNRMPGDRYVIVEVTYEPDLHYGRSLEWIAPELKDADLILTEDRTNEPGPSRTWAGIVDGATFERFARAWNIDNETDLVAPMEGHRAAQDYTFDGMNWEAGGESPIVYVALHVSVVRDGYEADAEAKKDTIKIAPTPPDTPPAPGAGRQPLRR